MTHVADENKLEKFFRFMHGVSERALKNSLDIAQLVKVVQVLLDKNARTKNLLEYVDNGCPKVDYIQPVPKANLGKSKQKFFNEAQFFKTRDGLWIDDDLGLYVGLKNCLTRGAGLLKRRSLKENEEEASMFGQIGTDKHTETLSKVVDLGQIGQKIEAQWNGEEGELLTNGYANIFPVLGASGALYLVRVIRRDGDWRLYCRPFTPNNVWGVGRQEFSS